MMEAGSDERMLCKKEREDETCEGRSATEKLKPSNWISSELRDASLWAAPIIPAWALGPVAMRWLSTGRM